MSLSEAVVVLMEVTVPAFMYSWTPMTETMIDKTKDPNTTFRGKNQYAIKSALDLMSLKCHICYFDLISCDKFFQRRKIQLATL